MSETAPSRSPSSTGRRRLALATALLSAALSCQSPPITPTPDPSPDVVAPPTMRCELSAPVWPAPDAAPPTWGTGRTLTYALSSITVDPEREGEAPPPVAGFNLDQLFPGAPESADCRGWDLPSDLDCDSNCDPRFIDSDGRCSRPGCVGASCIGGVDNQLPGALQWIGSMLGRDLRGTDVRTALEHAYAAGQTALVVQLSGVDSLEHDDLVAVRVLPAIPLYRAPDGGSCAVTRRDQRYAIASRAVRDSDPARLVARDGVGRIHRGQLRARFSDTIQLPFIDGGPSIRDWPIERAQLAVNLTEAEGSHGNFGGAVTAATLLQSFSNADPPAFIGLLVLSYLDLQSPDGACAERSVCSIRSGRIGVGLRFSLVRAVLEARVLDESPVDTCPRAPLRPTDGGVPRFDAGSFCNPDAQ